MDSKNDYLAQITTPTKVVVHRVELEAILPALSSYRGLEDELRSSPTYFTWLEHKSQMYSCYTLYKRLFDRSLSCKERQTISLNHAEVRILQEAIQRRAEMTGDSILASVFGRIHRETFSGSMK